MFPKLSLLATSLMVTLAVANYPAPPPGTQNLCCSFVATNTNPVMQIIAGLIPADISSAPNLLAVDCTVIDVFGDDWYDSAHVVSILPANVILCSSNVAVNCQAFNQIGGIISDGCIPISF
ncbi:hypothetical protein GGX14DRAFT_580933 [Mycena pura]|uniref:Hydrophobin n=1 Tax=Mycena pura TaxID=153505 RepID=A0AAD6UPD8_9AGAR|nr:hypothetical protein GGX14DRAFT_580933 [Mycena pura]